MTENERSETAKINALLKEKMLRRMPAPGTYPTAVAGFNMTRREEINQSENCFGKPSAAVVIQGAKCTVLGSREYRYGENQYLVTGVDLPSAFYVLNPSSEKPFLALSIELDPYQIAQLAAEVPPPSKSEAPCRGAFVADAEADLLSAFLRLAELLDKPEQIKVRAPMIIRELHYLLLIGPYGGDLRQLNTFGTQSNQVTQAVAWLRTHYRDPLHVDALARRVNMATSTFHRHFKEVTGLSPLQFHKRLRLYEAQRLMLAENHGAGSAALAVGYESATQFNREYKRLFGEPPHRDMSNRRLLMS